MRKIKVILAESFNNTYSYGYKIFSATFGGPVLKGRDRVRFFLSGEGRLLDDRFPRATVQGQLPHNSLEGFNWQSKLSIRLKQAMELEISSFGSVSNDEIYIHS
ncbi:MAG: hypothetical protein IIB58_12080, partial [Planctomycetes bacterium]|nr:hypothetical protein [Planctomycetota bacterium]